MHRGGASYRRTKVAANPVRSSAFGSAGDSQKMTGTRRQRPGPSGSIVGRLRSTVNGAIAEKSGSLAFHKGEINGPFNGDDNLWR